MKKILLSKFFYFLSLSLLIICSFCINITFISKYTKILYFFMFLFLVVSFFLQNNKISKKNILYILFLLILLLFNLFFSQDYTLLILFTFIICKGVIPFKDICKYDLIFKIILSIIIISLCLFGVISNYSFIRDGYIIRNSLGFSHPNILSLLVFSCICDYIYLSKDYLRKKNLLIIIIISILVSYMTDSRTFLFSIILLITMIILPYKKYLNINIIKKIIINSCILLTLFSFTGALLVNKNDFFTKMNETTSNRLLWANKFINYYHINLFGNKIKTISTVEAKNKNINMWILDNSYILLVLRFGLIASCIFIYFFKKNMKYLYIDQSYIILIIFFVFGFYSLTETCLYRLQFNVFLLSFSQLINVRRDDTNEKNIVCNGL